MDLIFLNGVSRDRGLFSELIFLNGVVFLLLNLFLFHPLVDSFRMSLAMSVRLVLVELVQRKCSASFAQFHSQ